jgi:hypothetical protein
MTFPYPPPPPEHEPRRSWFARHKIATVAGVLLLLCIVISVASTSGSSGEKQTADAPTTQAQAPAKKAPKAKSKPAAKPEKDVVTFKVWGTAPAGALGPLDITYGSDSDSRQGSFGNGKFTTTLPLDDDAMYYNVTAQLQGSGEIWCSVTVGGEAKKGHASGGYNICDAQLSSGLFGGWD